MGAPIGQALGSPLGDLYAFMHRDRHSWGNGKQNNGVPKESLRIPKRKENGPKPFSLIFSKEPLVILQGR